MQPGFNVGHGVISVSASIDKDQIARAVGDAGKRAGQGLIKSIAENLKRDKGATVAAGSAGEEAGESFGRRFSSKVRSAAGSASKSLSSGLGKMAGPGIMAALLPAMTAAGPLLGSALAVGIGGALIAGLGVAGIGAGIALVASTPEVKGAFDGLKKTVTNGLKEAAKPFIGPVVQSIGIFKKTFDQVLPSIQRMFQFLAPYVTQFAKGISDTVLKVMPAIENVVTNSGPLLSGMASTIGKLGTGVAAFLEGTVGLFNKIKALWSGNGGAGPFSNLPLIIEKVKALGGTFMSIFNDIKQVFMDNKTQFQTLINFVMGLSNILWSAVGPIFKALGVAIKAVIGILGGLIDFFAGVFTGDWKRAGDGIKKIWFSLWEGIKGILNNAAAALKNITFGIWNGIKGSVTGFKNWFVNGWRTMWTNAKNDVTNIGTSIKNAVTNLVDSIKTKFNAFKNNTITAFTAAKDGVAKVWNKLKEVAKAPVNFVIDPVYANIKNLWNSIASKVGLKELPNIAKFAKGGIAPGVGSRDTVPAMLTPGEGILTKKEMKKIGGPKGFAAFRNQLQYFNDGGIVGWVKDKLGGAVRGGLYSGAKSVADRWVYPFINQMQGGDGFEGLMKAGANTLIDKALSWIKGDDKKNALHFGNYPSSPSAQRGDSGVWRSVVKLIKSGPKSGSFGNAYRPGDPLWHGSGRAVDWMGYNQDALASFLASKRPLELIHRTNRRDYAYTRGQNMGSFDNPLMEEHRNHIHVAMDKGGVIPPKSTAMVTNATSDKEFAMTVEHLKGVVGATNIYATLNVNMEDLDSVAKLIDVIEQLPRALQAGVQTAY